MMMMTGLSINTFHYLLVKQDVSTEMALLWLRRCWLATLIFLSILLIMFYYMFGKEVKRINFGKQVKHINFGKQVKHVNFQSLSERKHEQDEEWQRVPNTSLLIYSAFVYISPLSNHIRVIGAMLADDVETEKFLCLLVSNTGKALVLRGNMRLLESPPPDAQIRSTILTCEFTIHVLPFHSSTIVSIGVSQEHMETSARYLVPLVDNASSVKQWSGSSPRSPSVGLCVGRIYTDDATHMLQYVEMHRLLGVEKIFFYEERLGRDVKQVIDMYVREGFVEIRPWTLPDAAVALARSLRLPMEDAKRPLLFYSGNYASLNDCLFRNRKRGFDFLAVYDLDEVIVPSGEHLTWTPLLRRYAGDATVASLEFGSFKFVPRPQSKSLETLAQDTAGGTNLPAVASTLQFLSENKRARDLDAFRNKSIHRPYLANQGTTSHRAFLYYLRDYRMLRKVVHVPPEAASVHHYREPEVTREIGVLIPDTSMEKYSESLVMRVGKRIRQIQEGGYF